MLAYLFDTPTPEDCFKMQGHEPCMTLYLTNISTVMQYFHEGIGITRAYIPNEGHWSLPDHDFYIEGDVIQCRQWSNSD